MRLFPLTCQREIFFLNIISDIPSSVSNKDWFEQLGKCYVICELLGFHCRLWSRQQLQMLPFGPGISFIAPWHVCLVCHSSVFSPLVWWVPVKCHSSSIMEFKERPCLCPHWINKGPHWAIVPGKLCTREVLAAYLCWSQTFPNAFTLCFFH